MKRLNSRWLDTLWLVLLGLYVLAGMPIASFHGDEPMHIYMSHDYATAFIYREPQRLMVNPPYYIDSDPQLRLLNGSVTRYTIGLSWHLAGMTNGDLPPAPGWDWGLDYETNVATNHRPSERMLLAGRIPSTLFLILSIPIMFALGWQLGGRPLAYIASGLYALNPIVLLNGRRAMMESPTLFFGLLVILIAVMISRRRAEAGRVSWGWWLGLILGSALAIASKHTAVVFVAAAFIWIFVAEISRRQWRALPLLALRLAVCGAAALALFVALSPALWNDPVARFQDLIAVREELLDIQVDDRPTSIPLRGFLLVAHPYIAPLAHFELEHWRDFAPITAEIERYMASPLSGLQLGVIGGGLLMLLAGVGLVALWWRPIPSEQILGLLLWLLITIAYLMINPLPWQRYYLPIIPIYILLSGIGLLLVGRWLARRLPTRP